MRRCRSYWIGIVLYVLILVTIFVLHFLGKLPPLLSTAERQHMIEQRR